MTWLRTRWPVLFLALAPLLPLWRAVFLGEAIGPWDHIRSMAPWNGPAPQTPWDVLQADGVLQFAPWRSLVFDSWAHGKPPFWNPYELMGTPLLANSQSAGFYPPHILMGLLHVPLYPAMTFLAWLHLFIAGLGVYVLVRRLGGTKTGGAIAGASFSLSAFMVSWTALPSVISTVAWIPWVLACVLAIYQTNVFWGMAKEPFFKSEQLSVAQAVAETETLRRSHNRWTCALIACIAMMTLAGHLQFLAFGLFSALLFAIVLTIDLLRLNKESPMKVIMNVTGSDIKGRQSESRLPFWPFGSMSVLRILFAIAIGICI